uniref:Uncharacterized protein n=1 Tax=Timema poppense TaxID=170557 RepID=A0A7R9DBE7_TIMPO|nr:unnamed protein product [Timema poppensis]
MTSSHCRNPDGPYLPPVWRLDKTSKRQEYITTLNDVATLPLAIGFPGIIIAMLQPLPHSSM